jgi:hypothetical protein
VVASPEKEVAMKRTILFPTLCLVFFAFLLGCGDGEPTVIGYWKNEKIGFTSYRAFLPDGTSCYGFRDAEGDMACFPGTYSRSGGQCVLELEDKETITLDILTIEKTRLCLTQLRAGVSCFVRISAEEFPCDCPPDST